MKCRLKKLMEGWQYLLLSFLVIGMAGCKDDNTNSNAGAFDPTKPVVVSDFTPREGGAYQKMLIYGSNFGTDVAKVGVTIGGKKATVINVDGEHIYCIVPSGAFSGVIEVTVGEGDRTVTATAETKFVYEKKMVVGTLCGYRNNRDDQGWRDGPFDGPEGVKCCGFTDAGRMAVDPLNKDLIYICYDGHKSIQLIDLKNRMLSTPLNINTVPTGRIRSVCFNTAIPGYATEGQYMIISCDYDGRGDESPSVYIIERNEDGTFNDNSHIELLGAYKQCNGATVHPINGELYFNSYEKGQVFRLDLRDYFDTINRGETWDPRTKNNPCFKMLFTIADPGWEFQIFFHPTGKYAYFGVINQHYFMRSDYDEEQKELITPYNFAGAYKQEGYRDDVGTSAMMRRPMQAVFVKNPEYAGRVDEYDLYFVDAINFCVRKITPEGIVSTFAGRGTNTSLADGNAWGTDDGDLRDVARFRDVSGLIYDDEKEIFYVHDWVGHTIRTISMEHEPDELPEVDKE